MEAHAAVPGLAVAVALGGKLLVLVSVGATLLVVVRLGI